MKSHEYGLELMKTMHSLGSNRVRFHFGELTKGEFAILSLIKDCGDNHSGNHRDENVYASDIASQLDLMPPAVSRILKTLEEKGYAERVTDKKDRRNTIVVITQEGIKVRDRQRQELGQLMDRVITAMGEEDAQILINKLKLFNHLLEKEVSEKRKEPKIRHEKTEAEVPND